MENQSEIQLHFDVLSCRALLCCAGKEYLLPDTYPSREAAHAAAQTFVREKLGFKDPPSGDVAIWLR
ncbi:MAG: hypothetical protein ACT6U0_10750 [Shinella sp.]|uniref:hypothetical protein n=1 Tax=Shinella sp. TaxID=1870904 RepID=UPI00403589B3